MWKVCIPSGRWMAGVNYFNTKARALSFIDRWNEAEVKSGDSALSFIRRDKVWKQA